MAKLPEGWGLFKGQMDLDRWFPDQAKLDHFVIKDGEPPHGGTDWKKLGFENVKYNRVCVICGAEAKYKVLKKDYCGACAPGWVTSKVNRGAMKRLKAAYAKGLI